MPAIPLFHDRFLHRFHGKNLLRECRVYVIIEDLSCEVQMIFQIGTGSLNGLPGICLRIFDQSGKKKEQIIFHIRQKVELAPVILIERRPINVSPFAEFTYRNMINILFLQHFDQRVFQHPLCHGSPAVFFLFHKRLSASFLYIYQHGGAIC